MLKKLKNSYMKFAMWLMKNMNKVYLWMIVATFICSVSYVYLSTHGFPLVQIILFELGFYGLTFKAVFQ